MYKSKLSKVIVSLLRRVLGVTRSGAKRLMRAMLRSLMAMGRRANLPVAGFVLPTVTMVLLVVILLTVAITLRSFDRANNARNVRVNQQVLAAATPAIDRAKAKIQFLLYEDPRRPTATPSDAEMYRIMSSYNTTNDFYTFGDEARLVVKADLDNNNVLDPTPTNLKSSLLIAANKENEELNTAWRYPVDTNNDNIFDTFTLYGIYFRTPKTTRVRRELDARTPPMRTGTINPACAQGEGTVASLVGDSGWERLNGRFQKSFFVYTVNVPITQTDIENGLNPPNQYQAFPGTTSISALEYQQDQSRIPLSNNAVVYEDDLEISPAPPLNLNGRIFTNSNFLVTGLINPNTVQLYQVSSKASCFYDQENSRIVVGGNVVNGWSGNNASINPVGVHLFKNQADPNQPNTTVPTINQATNQSVNENSLQVLYNNNAYSERLAALVAGQIEADPTGNNDPVYVQQAQQAPKNQSRSQALQDYFKERLRKVTFAEAPLASAVNGKYLDPNVPNTSYRIQDAGNNSLRPANNSWSLPNGTATVGARAGAGLNIRPAQLEAEDPDKLKLTDSENFLGNRVTVGNNLPALRWNGTSFTNKAQQVDGTTTWGNNSSVIRTRTPQVTKLADVGATERGNGVGEAPGNPNSFSDGFWEKSAAEKPRTRLDGVGGLRVITSAGVYDRTNSFLPPPTWIDGTGTRRTGPASIAIAPVATTNTYNDPETLAVEQYRVVWPDSMPMSPLGAGSQVYDNVAGAWAPWPTGAAVSGTGLPAAVNSTTLLPGIAEQNTTARKFAKGDLRMRATAVYQYANGFDPVALEAAPGTQPTQIPLACVSSYYDPSNASTARNISPPTGGALPDVSGEGALAPDVATRNPGLGSQQAFIGSHNGITYGPPTRSVPGQSIRDTTTGLLTGGDAVLAAQANLVFPDGRFANGPLRTALQVLPNNRTLAQQAAIDSTNCAIQILDGSIGAPQPTLIPHGAIQEVAFINGREIKAVDRDDPNTIVNETFTLSSPLVQPHQQHN
ncbi:MAG: hormogonium polysaccharide biosynthesis protein HpsA [Microcoleus sp.]